LVDQFLDWLARLPTAATYLILMALSATENVFPPVPADVAVVLGAFLSRKGETSAVLVGVLCWMANTVSSAGMFFYARSKGRAFFETGWPRRLMPPRAVEALEGAYARHGVFGIFMSRFLPGIRAGVTPVAGLLGMRPMSALVPAATASAIWYTFLVLAGTALGLSWESAKHMVEDLNRVLAFVSLAAVVVLVIWLWRRNRAA
jgi:membrane protein DedA with SNARE-associated domain